MPRCDNELEIRKLYEKRQDHRCAICSVKFSKKVRPCLDHDHRTKGFRGVLCHSCNVAIGLFCDSPELLRKALEYLETPRIVRYPRHPTVSEIMTRIWKERLGDSSNMIQAKED